MIDSIWFWLLKASTSVTLWVANRMALFGPKGAVIFVVPARHGDAIEEAIMHMSTRNPEDDVRLN